MPDRAEEARLIAGVIGGREDAFREMYRAYGPRLYLLALRMTCGVDADAEDVVQEGWQRAVRGLEGFEGRSSLRTWLASIVVRCALEKYRADGPTPDCHSPECPVGNEEHEASSRVDLERAFEQLPEGFRTVLVLHDLEGYRHTDIAELLGVSEGTSKSQLSRARGRMRELLGEDYAGS
jgi:RNA polymerase sigma-70 factor (ECF subfamily)